MNPEQIDLENLFSDPKNMPEFIPDYSIDEIDKALNEALAEINEKHSNIETESLLTPKSQTDIHSNSEERDFKRQKTSSEDIDIKPLSPESLHSDTSLINSPRHEMGSNETSSLKAEEALESMKAQLIDSQLNNEKLKMDYESKCKDLEKLMKELHKSELKRFKLMEENNHLKKAVTSLAFQ